MNKLTHLIKAHFIFRQFILEELFVQLVVYNMLYIVDLHSHIDFAQVFFLYFVYFLWI